MPKARVQHQWAEVISARKPCPVRPCPPAPSWLDADVLNSVRSRLRTEISLSGRGPVRGRPQQYLECHVDRFDAGLHADLFCLMELRPPSISRYRILFRQAECQRSLGNLANAWCSQHCADSRAQLSRGNAMSVLGKAEFAVPHTTPVDCEQFRLRRFVDLLAQAGELQTVEEDRSGRDRRQARRQRQGSPVQRCGRGGRSTGRQRRRRTPAVGSGIWRKGTGSAAGDWAAAEEPHRPRRVRSADAPVHQVMCTGDEADLTRLPVHLQHGLDGGVYISASIDVSESSDGQSAQHWLSSSDATRTTACGCRSSGAKRSTGRLRQDGRARQADADCVCDRVESGRQHCCGQHDPR